MLLSLACASPPPELPDSVEADSSSVQPSVPPQIESAESGRRPAHLDTALAYAGVTEASANRGPEIERFLANVGLRGGNPYCAAFVSYSLDAASVAAPSVRSALASDFILPTSIRSLDVLRGAVAPPSGSIIVWRKGNTIFGHAGLVIEWDGASGRTIEANTSSGVHGNQRDGEGIYERDRTIQPGSYFRITNFTVVTP